MASHHTDDWTLLGLLRAERAILRGILERKHSNAWWRSHAGYVFKMRGRPLATSAALKVDRQLDGVIRRLEALP